MSQEEGVDELDALLDSYSAQAARETASSQARHSKAASKGKTPSASTRLTSGLSQPLPADNKGLKMMQSMGYKPGSGLGKQGQGMAAPLAVDIRGKRTGLGVEEAKRQREAQQVQEAEAQKAKRARLEASNTEAFKDATRSGFIARRTLQHLRQAWASTAQLLEKAGAQYAEGQSTRPVPLLLELTALFPKLLAEGHLSAEEVMDAAPASAREAAADRGRSQSAPPWDQESEDEGPQTEAAAMAEAAAEEAAADAAALGHQLHLLLSHLREQHAYCLWCGAAYDSVQQLRECCPGEAEEDH